MHKFFKAAALAAICVFVASAAQAQGKRSVVRVDNDGGQVTEIPQRLLDIGSNMKGKSAGKLGYVSSALDIGENCLLRVSNAQEAYDRATRRGKAAAAGRLNEANNDCGRSVVSAIRPFAGTASVNRPFSPARVKALIASPARARCDSRRHRAAPTAPPE